MPASSEKPKIGHLTFNHQPVLCQEVLNSLNIEPSGIYIDGTFGRGGHSQAVLAQLSAEGRLIAFDQDPEAIAAGQVLAEKDKRFTIIHACFDSLLTHLQQLNLAGNINGILLDLGVSSPQLDNPQRGFSFMQTGDLDMRMNPDAGESVAQWLTHAKAETMTEIFKKYGEERFSKRIANAIVAMREITPIQTTTQLAEIVAKAQPFKEKHKHPATRTFQALRIFINQELAQLENVLPQAIKVLKPKGRLAVISFHSLEDRIVKRFMRDKARGDHYPSKLPITEAMLNRSLQVIGKAITATESEIQQNPRARSAVLRIAERY